MTGRVTSANVKNHLTGRCKPRFNVSCFSPKDLMRSPFAPKRSVWVDGGSLGRSLAGKMDMSAPVSIKNVHPVVWSVIYGDKPG